jgi:hypothetical protein
MPRTEFPEYEQWKDDLEARPNAVFAWDRIKKDTDYEDEGPRPSRIWTTDNASTTTIVNEQPKVGRNDPCPCGSGKKYKKCCLKTQSFRSRTGIELAVSPIIRAGLFEGAKGKCPSSQNTRGERHRQEPFASRGINTREWPGRRPTKSFRQASGAVRNYKPRPHWFTENQLTAGGC